MDNSVQANHITVQDTTHHRVHCATLILLGLDMVKYKKLSFKEEMLHP